MNRKAGIIIIVLLIIHVHHLLAQENNYWFNNYGAGATLRGGIATAGTRTVSAIYYNPGALPFIENDFFEGQADVLAIDYLRITNAGGDQVNLNYLNVDVAPSLFGYLKRLNKNPKMAYAIGVLTKYVNNYSFLLNHEEVGNYLLPDDELDVFQGQYKYENRVRESWVVGSVSYRLSQHIGVGLSTNIFIRTQDFNRSYSAVAFHEDERNLPNQNFSKIANNLDQEELHHRALGFIFKGGIDFDYDDLKLGMTITSPSISLGLLNNQSQRAHSSFLPDKVQKIQYSSAVHTYYAGVYKTPFSVNIGADYTLKKLTLSIATEWFAKIDKYQIIKEKDNSVDLENPTSPDPNYAIPVMANKSVINAGFSVAYRFNERLIYVGSFRTDFNFIDDEVLDRTTDFVPNMTFWDIYHIASGMIITGPRTDLTFGVNYGFGSSSDTPQFVSMTSASQDNYLRGDIQNNASVQYSNISFTLGFNFNIDFKKGLKEEKI